MDTMFRMRTRKSMGNLHVRLEGVFNPESATSLALVLRKEADGCNRFFINTEELERVEPRGAAALRSFMQDFADASSQDMTSRIYFKGRNGGEMALDGQRILQIKPGAGSGCSGKCVVCKCSQRREQRRGVDHEKSPDS